ncbi:MAG: hypothetical protein MR966_07980 [Lachnospiraceae bacterium]|nr:hypothetical protein [Lachnospiraceae bacterium]
MERLKGNTNIVSYEDHKIIPHDDGIGWDILIRMELLTPLSQYLRKYGCNEKMVVRLGIDICNAFHFRRRSIDKLFLYMVSHFIDFRKQERETMISGVIVAGIILLLIVINIVYLQKQRKNEISKEIDDSIKTESSKLILGNEYISEKEKTVIHNDAHMISVIYRDKEKTGVWICPNCEAENAASCGRCSVCNRKK